MSAKRSSVLKAVSLFQEVCPAINLTQMAAFLYIAENEGLSGSELAVLLHTTRATASRTTKFLAGAADRASLIKVNPDRTVGYKALTLTPTGKDLARRLDHAVAEAIFILER